MTTALSRQEGGTHYVGMGMQPIEFAMANCWDNCAFSTLKYVSRYRSKNGIQDLKKGKHFIDIRESLIHYVGTTDKFIPMTRYIAANSIPDSSPDATALMTLEAYVQQRVGAYAVISLIELLIVQFQGGDQLSLLPHP